MHDEKIAAREATQRSARRSSRSSCKCDQALFYDPTMVPEAPPKATEDGLVAVGGGWFVLNARDARWNHRPGRQSVTFTGSTEFEADTYFPQLGVNLLVLGPGEPNAMYHWETETEAFLVLSGEALLIVEGQERPLRQWDFVHSPPKTGHVIVGAGDGPCVVLAMSSRENQAYGPYGAYTVDEVALRHGACVDEETQRPGGRVRARSEVGADAISRRLAPRLVGRTESLFPGTATRPRRSGLSVSATDVVRVRCSELSCLAGGRLPPRGSGSRIPIEWCARLPRLRSWLPRCVPPRP
jgi:uncharacterized cupin superfamily protein